MEGGGVDINGDSLMMGIDMMMMLPPPLPNHPNINNPLLALMNTSTTTTTTHASLPPPHPHHHPSNAGMINTLFHPHSSSSSSNHNNNNYHQLNSLNHNTSSSTTPQPHHLMMSGNNNTNTNHNNNNNNNNNNITIAAPGCYFMNNNHHMTTTSSSFSFRDKIMAHPHYPRLLSAYINCQKVGAPPEVVERLERIFTAQQAALLSCMSKRGCLGEDPALDQFMEAYCEMLTKYEQELTKPFQEAMLFFSSIESQLKGLTIASSSDSAGLNGSSEEELDASDGFIDPRAEDRELKVKLLRKYSGYLGSLKQEFMKKRKKGKLPKNARQQLLDWWSRHYKWPYPSESQKLALAESTGLDQKQINNWFINQRKRHWKPSEEMQFMVMDTMHHPQYYIDNVMMNNPFPIDYCPQPSLL